MSIRSSKFLKLVVACGAASALVAGCGKKDDPVAEAAKKDAATGVAVPSIAEIKAIAEEGFIYGLPIVMNYAVMNEYAINKDSGQFKAPFNQGKTQLLIENPINRYLINSPMLPGMKKNEDGSLTLYVQKDSPGKEKESNWLPAPNGPIYPVMRLYWPKTEPPSILPVGEGTWKPPALVATK